WDEYDWRGLVRGRPLVYQDFKQPRWDGSQLNGKRILIHSEQGFGDTIQFSRYLRMVADRGGEGVFQCQRELHRPLQNQSFLKGVRIIARDEPLDEFDLHCPLVSLPRVFKTTLETIPSSPRYLEVDPEWSSPWRERMAAEGMKVGLAWAGSTTHRND